MRVVLDASVLIAGFLSETGASRTLLHHAQARTFQLVLSPAILNEVARNLRRLNVATETVGNFVDILRSFAVVIWPARVPQVIREHPPDDHILACAVASGADELITLDRRHLLPLKEHQGIPIRLPKDLLRDLPPLPA